MIICVRICVLSDVKFNKVKRSSMNIKNDSDNNHNHVTNSISSITLSSSILTNHGNLGDIQQVASIPG